MLKMEIGAYKNAKQKKKKKKKKKKSNFISSDFVLLLICHIRTYTITKMQRIFVLQFVLG